MNHSNTRKFKKRLLNLLLTSSLCAPSIVLAQEAQISGLVLGPADNRLEGAIITIVELGVDAVSDKEGRYRFQDVDPGNYTIAVNYLGLPSMQMSVTVGASGEVSQNLKLISNDVEIINVEGTRAAFASAINQERASDTLKSVVGASDAGKFADQNIAEALQRLPGVSIQRSDGEGRFVSIRGLGPNFTNVKLNGARVPSTETAAAQDRAVALDVIPAELMENMEVSKFVTPEDDGDTIGGTVSVASLSAFQRDGRFMSYKAEIGNDERSGENGYKGSFIFSDTFADDTLGLAISLSVQDRNYLVENVEGDPDNEAIVESEDGNGFRTNIEPNARTLNLGRERQSASVGLDFRPESGDEYYARATYSHLLETEFRNRSRFELDRGDIFLTADNVGVTEEARIRKELRDQDEDQEILTLSIGGVNYLDDWELDYSASFSRSIRDEDDWRIEFRTSDFDNVAFRFNKDSFFLNGVDADENAEINTASNYNFRRFRFIEEDSEDKNTEIQINASREVDWGSIKIGAKYFKKNKVVDESLSENRQLSDLAESTAGDMSLLVPIEADYTLGYFGPTADIPSSIALYQNLLASGDVFASESRQENNFRQSFLSDYDSTETITAAYVKATWLASDSVTVIGGFRFEQTDFETNGFVVDTNEASALPLEVSNDYNDILPSVNVRWDISDELVFRGGYYASVVRPTFARNNASVRYDFDEDEDTAQTRLTIEAGNPALEPFTADSFDLNLAWYPSDFVGVVQAGVFIKNIDNFNLRTDIDENSALGQEIIERGGLGALAQQSDDIRINNVTVNGDTAKVRGLELSYYQELPAGFNINANATFTDSEADLAERQISLIGQADETGNLSLGWENEKWDLRVTAAYNGDFLVRLNSEDDPINDAFTDARTQLDLGIKYQLNDNAQLYFDAINLTQEPEFEEYMENGSGFTSVYNNIERTFLFGVRGSFK